MSTDKTSKGRKVTWGAKISKANKGRIITWGDKISKSKMGHPQSNTGRTHFKKGSTPWNKDKHLSKKTKEKISISKIGRKHSEETKRRMGLSHKGHECSLETRKKISKKAKSRKYNGDTIIKHHIYLKENSKEIIKIAMKSHRQLHSRAYDYIYYKYGKKGIDSYIKWFKKNYIKGA